MKLLLDTHAFLWWVEDAPQLSSVARKVIQKDGNEIYFSMASCWEMAIKSSIGKLKLTVPVRNYVPQHLSANGFKQLAMTFRHVSAVESLELHHRDPFDRLIVAQAMIEGMSIVSADTVLDLYDDARRIW